MFFHGHTLNLKLWAPDWTKKTRSTTILKMIPIVFVQQKFGASNTINNSITTTVGMVKFSRRPNAKLREIFTVGARPLSGLCGPERYATGNKSGRIWWKLKQMAWWLSIYTHLPQTSDLQMEFQITAFLFDKLRFNDVSAVYDVN